MVNTPSASGLRYNAKGIWPGAQTERPDVAEAGEEIASRQNLTGRSFPDLESPLFELSIAHGQISEVFDLARFHLHGLVVAQ